MIFPIASERRVRKYTSVPGVRHIFQQEQQPPPTPKLSRKRSSARSSRRSSADWSSRQATFGVTSNTFGEYGWPAEVSREMIRLSLGDAPERQVDSKRPQRVRTTSAKSGIIQRGHNVPHAIEVAGRPCPPLPSPNPLPPNTEGNSESGDKSSWPHHFQDHYPVSHKSGGAVEGQSSMSVRNGAELSTLREEGDDSRQAATLPRAAGGTRGYRKSILRQSSSLNTQGSEAGPSSLQSTPTSSPYPSRRPSLRSPARHASEPTLSQVPETPTSNKGKRKAEDLDVTPPDLRFTQHTTFVIPTDHRRTHHQSEPSRAPSAYQHKRVRLSSQSPAPSPTPTPSRPGSSLQNANITGTPSSRISNPPPSPANRALSRAASTRSMQPSFASGAPPSAAESRRDRRRSLSEISIPIGAIVAPQPPSLSRSSTYHMRDPRRPPRIQPTSWVPHTKSEDEEASPIHAWLFYTAFVLFPLWWIAAFLPIPRTRHVGGSDTEKAVTLDDPQIEHDARSWRFRCRIMGCVSFLTYIPFIVLVAVFASR
ncbi:hypothetical protein BDW22DRAFT_894366 [Trametopsis cervina]|nr:hypothetical protein BDW22DRAFT_894366 [Trametopsis cervina]